MAITAKNTETRINQALSLAHIVELAVKERADKARFQAACREIHGEKTYTFQSRCALYAAHRMHILSGGTYDNWDMEYLGSGVSKCVYLMHDEYYGGDVVLKIGNMHSQSYQIFAELKLFLDVQKNYPELLPRLATLYKAFTGYATLVQERADIIVDSDEEAARYAGPEEHKRFTRDLLALEQAYGLWDVRGGNYGIMADGRIAVVDYGSYHKKLL